MTSPADRPLQRILGLGFGLALAFGSTVGVGILRLPGTLAAALGDSRLVILFWIIGGMYALFGAVAVAERGIVHARIGLAAAFGFVIAAALFAGDLTLRQYAGHGLFPMAAPTGGTLLIASWLALAAAAAWPRRG